MSSGPVVGSGLLSFPVYREGSTTLVSLSLQECDRGFYLVAWMEGMTKSTSTSCPHSFALSPSAQQDLAQEEVTANVQLQPPQAFFDSCHCPYFSAFLGVCYSKPSSHSDGSRCGPALYRGLPVFQPSAPLFVKGWLSSRCFGFTLVS